MFGMWGDDSSWFWLSWICEINAINKIKRRSPIQSSYRSEERACWSEEWPSSKV